MKSVEHNRNISKYGKHKGKRRLGSLFVSIKDKTKLCSYYRYDARPRAQGVSDPVHRSIDRINQTKKNQQRQRLPKPAPTNLGTPCQL